MLVNSGNSREDMLEQLWKAYTIPVLPMQFNIGKLTAVRLEQLEKT